MMQVKTYAPDSLNPQASALVDCQTDIKIAVKNGVLGGAPFSVIQKKVQEIIHKALAKIKSQTLKQDALKSLIDFANRVYKRLKIEFPNVAETIAVYALVSSVTKSIADGKTSPTAELYVPRTNAEKTAFKQLYGNTFYTTAKGIPLQEFQKTYIEKVKKALYGLAEEQALDPNDFTGRNSLRNLAEMQVRYEAHQEEIQVLKASGVKLVVCSVHGDCSVRCSKYQGRVYSLDGTRGTTEDGRSYVPIEEATQNPADVYVTKAGRTYQNGLFGFNCRHKLYPYKVGMIVPTVSAKEQLLERTITRRQRELERTVVRWRETALVQKNVDFMAYKESRKNAIDAYTRYKDFSKNNNRPYYPDRVKIL